MKSEIHKLEVNYFSLFQLEHIRKDKTLDDINNEIQTSMISGGKNDREVHLKIKETYMINSLKKELKELQNMSKKKTIDCENMKKSIKSIKMNDLNQEIMYINEELVKNKNRFEISLKENIEKENYIREYKQLQEVFAYQQTQLFQLSEEVKYKEKNLNAKEEELNNIKSFIKGKENYIFKLNKKNKINKQINEKKSKEMKFIDINALKNKIADCENKIPVMQSELTSYKKESE